MVTEQADQVLQEDVDAALPAVASSVEQLVAARQASGLGASDVAARMGMATRQIEALERGDWGSLPGQSFVRAALRSYGKAVGIAVDPLLATVGGQARTPELKDSASLASPIPRGGALGFSSGGGGSRVAWIVLGIVVVVAMSLYFGRAFDRAEPEPVAAGSPAAQQGAAPPQVAGAPGPAPSAASPAPATAASATAGATASAGGATAAGASGSISPLAPLTPLAPSEGAPKGAAPAGAAATAAAPPASGTDASATATSAATAAAPPAAEAVAPGTQSLRLKFARESWVDIRDAGGKQLLYGIQAAGSERELAGRKPFTLIIGNADHVTLERDGQPVDLTARARQGVARLTLD
jgi:cytoskeleton protein RodZ